MTRMKHASVLLATALASKVFPVPGGPNSRTPLGGSIPSFTKRSGCNTTEHVKISGGGGNNGGREDGGRDWGGVRRGTGEECHGMWQYIEEKLEVGSTHRSILMDKAAGTHRTDPSLQQLCNTNGPHC